VDSSKASSLSTREQVILLVVSQYIGTLRGMANVQASQSRVDLAQALYDQAADLQKEGVGTGIDTLRANVELQNEKQRLIQAQTDRETSLFALSRLLNLDPAAGYRAGRFAEFLRYTAARGRAEHRTRAGGAPGVEGRWNRKSRLQNIRRKRRRIRGFHRCGSTGISRTWELRENTALPTYTYQGSVNLPLFTGGRIHAEIVRADLEIRKFDQQKDDLRNQIALDVKTALLNLQSARNEVQVANLACSFRRKKWIRRGTASKQEWRTTSK